MAVGLRYIQRGVHAALQLLVRWLGWWSFIVLVITGILAITWWKWDQARLLPIPPQARHVSSQLIGALAKQTQFITPQSIAEVRTFYRQALLQRGWQYCGTQATWGCTNLLAPADGSGQQVDVYRQRADPDRTRPSIEVKVIRNAWGRTQVTIWEANPYARTWSW